MDGTNVVRIHSSEDLAELGLDINKPGSNLSLWCDGLIEHESGTCRKRGCSEAYQHVCRIDMK